MQVLVNLKVPFQFSVVHLCFLRLIWILRWVCFVNLFDLLLRTDKAYYSCGCIFMHTPYWVHCTVRNLIILKQYPIKWVNFLNCCRNILDGYVILNHVSVCGIFPTFVRVHVLGPNLKHGHWFQFSLYNFASIGRSTFVLLETWIFTVLFVHGTTWSPKA